MFGFGKWDGFPVNFPYVCRVHWPSPVLRTANQHGANTVQFKRRTLVMCDECFEKLHRSHKQYLFQKDGVWYFDVPFGYRVMQGAPERLSYTLDDAELDDFWSDYRVRVLDELEESLKGV